tara:strand:+ start:45 stop:461 length:417 start_codon:yes stop_codon:yes gene_type:complete
MPVASRTFVNLEVMQNADFDLNIQFPKDYNMATKDYSLVIKSDAGVVATTLKSRDSGTTVARIIKNTGDADTESYISIYIPATGAASVNTFGTDDFDDGFEGSFELLETSSGTPTVTTRQAEGDVFVRTAVTPFLAYP